MFIDATITKLMSKACDTQDGSEAMRFTQAALNAAHAFHVLSSLEIPRSTSDVSREPDKS
jgi:hypothetical protein